jgi:pimeloyl-ACP methyl ester carboxylesterase
MAKDMQEIRLPAGPIRYREAGSGPAIVFVHGYLVDGRLWDGVVDALADRFRCIAPNWPMGAQQVAMEPDADLSPPGVATIIEGFLEALDLSDAPWSATTPAARCARCWSPAARPGSAALC